MPQTHPGLLYSQSDEITSKIRLEINLKIVVNKIVVNFEISIYNKNY